MELNEHKMVGVVESPSVLREVGATSGAGPGGNHKGVGAAKAEGSTHSPAVQGGFTEGFAVDACGEEDEEDEGAHGQVEDRGARGPSWLPRRFARERWGPDAYSPLVPSIVPAQVILAIQVVQFEP